MAETRSQYPDDMILRIALQHYFAQYHFANGGYADKWFRIKLGPVFIPLPNIKARVAAVKIHDIHHVLTGYRADLKGEVEIAAWELASGCGRHWVAWVLNMGSFAIGLFLFPRSLFRAWRRGRSVTTNLYYGTAYDDVLLTSTVGALRLRVGLRAEGLAAA